MALQPNGRAPYTSSTAAIAVLNAYRSRGLGLPITAEILVKAGVPESISKRTHLSLVELELIDANGQPTPTFQAFRQTRGDEEYRTRLQEWLRDIYGDVLQYGDPSVDVLDRIQEAFRGYQPDGQRRAMAALFVGLWQYAGLPIAAEVSPAENRPAQPRRSSQSNGGSRPKRLKEQKPQGRNEVPPIPPQASVLFGVTENDIAALSETEFKEVWAALGKVARARSRRPEPTSSEPEISSDEQDAS